MTLSTPAIGALPAINNAETSSAKKMIWDNLAPWYLTLPLVIGGALTHICGAIGVKPLHITSSIGLTTTSKLLLHLSTDPEVKDFRGHTALANAVATNNYPLMEHLSALEATHDSHDMPTRTRAFSALVEKLSDPSTPPSQSLRRLIPIAKPSDLISQAMQKVTSLWQRWFGTRYTPMLGTYTVSNEESPIHHAAASGDIAELERLVTPGTNINIRDRYGLTPLCSAIIFDKLDTVEKLVTLGADINAGDSDGATPLNYAVSNNKHDIAEKLIALGADINARDPFGWTPLYRAVVHDMHDMAEKLITLGADVDTPIIKGMSALAMMQVNRSFDNTTVLEAALQASNGGTQEIDDRKLLANYFALNGISEMLGGPFKLGGLKWNQQDSPINVSASSFYSPIIKDLETGEDRLWSYLLQKLSSKSRQQFDSLDKSKIIKILRNSVDSIPGSTTTNIDDALERHAKGLPVAIVTGYSGHANSLILWGDEIAICDKNRKRPGVLLYTIKKTEALRKVLEKCITREETTETYFTKDIITELGLNFKAYGRQKPQKGPNCIIANSKVDLVTHFIHFAPLVGEAAAWELASKLKSCRSLATRVKNLQSYLSKHEKPLPFAPDLGLIGQIYNKKTGKPNADKQIRTMIEGWAAKKNINLEAVRTLSIVQAVLNLDPDSKMPDLSLVSRAYELKTGDDDIDRQLRFLIDLWVKEKNLQWQT